MNSEAHIIFFFSLRADSLELSTQTSTKYTPHHSHIKQCFHTSILGMN